jgi:O-succinylbenzoate synthase
MRVSQVYRWQIPMDAGVVLRERRLKTRDGLFIHLQEGEREGWGKFSPAGIQRETLEEAQAALLAWAQAWRDGAEPALPALPSVAFGISCAQAELAASCRRPRIIARRRSAPAIRMSCSPDWRRCPARKSLR